MMRAASLAGQGAPGPHLGNLLVQARAVWSVTNRYGTLYTL